MCFDGVFHPSPSIMRPDAIGSELTHELVAEAQQLREAYVEGQTHQAFTHLRNASQTLSELLNGFEVVNNTIVAVPHQSVEPDELDEPDTADVNWRKQQFRDGT